VCQAGWTWNGWQCAACEAGEFKSNAGWSFCETCLDNLQSVPGSVNVLDCLCADNITANNTQSWDALAQAFEISGILLQGAARCIQSFRRTGRCFFGFSYLQLGLYDTSPIISNWPWAWPCWNCPGSYKFSVSVKKMGEEWTGGASDKVKVESSGEDPRATGGLVSYLPHPRVNKTKQHTHEFLYKHVLSNVFLGSYTSSEEMENGARRFFWRWTFKTWDMETQALNGPPDQVAMFGAYHGFGPKLVRLTVDEQESPPLRMSAMPRFNGRWDEMCVGEWEWAWVCAHAHTHPHSQSHPHSHSDLLRLIQTQPYNHTPTHIHT